MLNLRSSPAFAGLAIRKFNLIDEKFGDQLVTAIFLTKNLQVDLPMKAGSAY